MFVNNLDVIKVVDGAVIEASIWLLRFFPAIVCRASR
jgi:hypothetical protein